MLYGGREHTSLLNMRRLRDRADLLDGWTKTYAMTGWRMGYAVWPKALAEHADAAGDQLPLLRQRGGAVGGHRRAARGRRTTSPR